MRIRSTAEKDIPAVRVMESSPDSCPWVYQWHESQHLSALQDADTGHWILEDDTGETVGYCIMKGLQNPFRVVELMRVVIGPKGQGLGRQAMEAIIRKVFTELGARRLWLDVVDTNDRAIRLYEELGFAHEGTLRESAVIQGKPVSMRIYGLLEREWIFKMM